MKKPQENNINKPPPSNGQSAQEQQSRISQLTQEQATESNAIQIPEISLPKSGGALKGIDEKFEVNVAKGTAGFNIPLPVTPGRNGFSPSLSLSYNSVGRNSPFGLGWSVALPSIQRKTDKRLPQYRDGQKGEEDIFIFSGAEDLVPFLQENLQCKWTKELNLAHLLQHFKISHISNSIFSLIIFFFLSLNPVFAQGRKSKCPDLNITTEQCCFTPNSMITFNWDGGCSNTQINIILVNPNTLTPVITVATGIANTGHYTWSVPGNVSLGNYLLYVEDAGQTSWDFGSTVTVAEDCSGQGCNCQPDFNFIFQNDGCSITFNTKISDNCKIDQLLWDFGDNNSTNSFNPTHTYTQNGTYKVCLTITYTDLTNSETCTEKICKYIPIETCFECCPVIPTFTYKVDECRTEFTSLNQQNECSEIIAWSWDFGDGSAPSNQTNPVHTYTQNGTYQVCLTATIQTTDGLVFQTILCRTVVIDDCNKTGCCPLNPSFNYSIDPKQLCEVDFAGAVLIDNCENSTQWNWDFGDGATSNLQAPTHSFSTNGTYQVCLTVRNQAADGTQCEENVCQAIQIINCGGGGGGTCSGVVLSQTNQTCNSSSGGSAVVQGTGGTAPYTYTWNGSSQLTGSFSNLPVGTHVIFITDANNCNGQVSVTITSEAVNPVTASGDQTMCSGGSAQLLASPMGTFQWSPASSLSCTTCPNPVATPIVTTTYTVNHIDLNGCVSSDQITVVVGDSVNLNIPDLVICPGQTVDLNPNPAAGNYLWQPNAGLSCTNCPNPQVTLYQPMTYSATMSNDGCIGTDTVAVQMHPSTGVTFTWQSLGDMLVGFDATPTGLQDYSWDFGDPNSSNNTTAGPSPSVTHNFSTPKQNYTVCLTTTDICGPIRVCQQIFIDVDCANKVQTPKKED